MRNQAQTSNKISNDTSINTNEISPDYYNKLYSSIPYDIIVKKNIIIILYNGNN